MVQDLYILMITAAVVSIIFKFLKQPVVLGYIVAGVLVGPYLFGETLVNADNVKAWGDIGVLFVLFCIGLEFRLKNLISSGKIAAVGEFSFIIASLGTSLGVLNPIIYPIIVASSVVTTFLTPYIMKAALPCYTFLYNHASSSLRAKIDRREQEVAAAENATASGGPSIADKARYAVRKTFFLKRLVNLFIKNMSAHEENDLIKK